MKYSVEFWKKAIREVRRLDRPVKNRIYDWVLSHLDGCENPRKYGQPLVGNHTGEWGYSLRFIGGKIVHD